MVHVIENLEILDSKVKSGALLGCLLKLLSHLFYLVLIVLCLLELLLNLSGCLLRLVKCLNEAIRLKDLLARIPERIENLVKDFTLFLRHGKGLLGIALSVFFLPR